MAIYLGILLHHNYPHSTLMVSHIQQNICTTSKPLHDSCQFTIPQQWHTQDLNPCPLYITQYSQPLDLPLLLLHDLIK